MKTYLVGGAIRDQQLNLPIKDRDWVVVGATAQAMLDLGFIQLDTDFPVFIHPQSKEEYALARTERKQGEGYKGFVIDANPSITLEQDLARRDLTINAIAMDESGQFIDPFDGMKDLHLRKLRHVSEAFVEDPIRLLRIARFLAYLGKYDFQVSHSTLALLKRMSTPVELSSIKPERFYQEMIKALKSPEPWHFFILLGQCGALDILLPNMSVWINGSQSLQRISEQSDDPEVRLMTVMFHALIQAQFPLELYLPLSKKAKQLMDVLVHQYAVLQESMDAEKLYQSMVISGAFKKSELFTQILMILKAVFEDKKQRFSDLKCWQQSLLELSSETFIQQGFSGPLLGQEIYRQRVKLLNQLLQIE